MGKIPLPNNHLGFPNSKEFIVLVMLPTGPFKYRHCEEPKWETVDSDSEEAVQHPAVFSPVKLYRDLSLGLLKSPLCNQ